MVRIPKHTSELQPYKSGKPISEVAREKNLSRIVKLASNENPLGPSPKAMAALRNAPPDLHRYPDPRSTELVEKLAKLYDRKPSQIMCAHGTDAVLAYIINAFTSEGDEVLTAEGTFIGLFVSVNKMARVLKKIPLREYKFDLPAIADAVGKQTRIVYLANPNNPTGSMFTASEFENFMKRVPSDVLVVLDEAYYTYARDIDGYPDGLSYNYDNLIVTRTLSKVYGLAGLRVGCAVGPEELIQELYKVKLTFEPNRYAQIAAMAALDDIDFLQETIETNARSLSRMAETFKRLGIRFVPSAANFLMLVLPSEEKAARFFTECLNRGLIVRHVNSFGVPNGVRINSGTDDETDFALGVIEEVYPLVVDTGSPAAADR